MQGVLLVRRALMLARVFLSLVSADLVALRGLEVRADVLAVQQQQWQPQQQRRRAIASSSIRRSSLSRLSSSWVRF